MWIHFGLQPLVQDLEMVGFRSKAGYANGIATSLFFEVKQTNMNFQWPRNGGFCIFDSCTDKVIMCAPASVEVRKAAIA